MPNGSKSNLAATLQCLVPLSGKVPARLVVTLVMTLKHCLLTLDELHCSARDWYWLSLKRLESCWTAVPVPVHALLHRLQPEPLLQAPCTPLLSATLLVSTGMHWMICYCNAVASCIDGTTIAVTRPAREHQYQCI